MKNKNILNFFFYLECVVKIFRLTYITARNSLNKFRVYLLANAKPNWFDIQIIKCGSFILRLLRSKIVLCIIMLNVITACKPPYGQCIDPADFGQNITGDYVVQGDGYYSSTPRLPNGKASDYGKWYNTGLAISAGRVFNINTTGTIYYCNIQTSVLNFCTRYSLTQHTGISLNQGELLVLTLLSGDGGVTYDPKNTSNSNMCDNNGNQTFTNGRCVGNNGIGLQVYIGGSGVLNDINRTLDPAAQGNFLERQGYQGYYFNDGVNRGLYLKVPNNGELTFKAYDSCTCSGDTNTSCTYSATGCCFYDNGGRYRLTAKIARCPVTNGVSSAQGALQVLVTTEDPNNGGDTSSAFNLTNGQYSNSVPRSGTLWLRVYDTPNAYQDNSGEYYVHVSSSSQSTVLSSLLSKLIDPIKGQLSYARMAIYNNLAGDSSFHRIVVVMINLYIIIYAIFFMFGLVQISQLDLVVRMIKIGVLFNLINSNISWKFFNDNLFNLFVNGSDYLLATVTTTTSTTTSSSGLFTFVDETIGQFFTQYTWIKLTSLLFSITGIAYACIIIAGMVIYILTVIEAIMSYLFALIAVSLMIAVAPLFIICILFEKTRELFDNWVKYTLNFSLQPVILFACIMFINKLVIVSFYQAMNFRVCWGCAIPFSFTMFNFKVHLFCYNYYLPQAAAAGSDPSMSNILTATLGTLMALFVLIIMFLMFIRLMEKVTDFAPEITNWIVGALGVNLSGQGSQSRQIMDNLKDLAKSSVGQDKASKQRRKDRSDINEAKDKERGGAKDGGGGGGGNDGGSGGGGIPGGGSGGMPGGGSGGGIPGGGSGGVSGIS